VNSTAIVLSGNLTFTTTTALSNVTGLGFAIGNSQTWVFDWIMTVGNIAATACKFGITVSAGSPTVLAPLFGCATSAQAFTQGVISATNTANSISLIAFTTTTGMVRISGVITATNGGACTVYPAVEAGSTLSTITVYANSALVAWESLI
jgi:hypothetical protein